MGNSWVESSGGKERYGNDDRVDGRGTVGNSLGRAPVGRSDTGMTTGWTEGKAWEIAWGELRWEGAMHIGWRTRGWTEGKPWEIAWGELRGKERWKRDDRVDGRETVGNSLGRAPVGRSDTGMTTGWTEGNRDRGK